ncbi:hypothetical protein ACJX0J_028970, partial [Zea mays]
MIFGFSDPVCRGAGLVAHLLIVIFFKSHMCFKILAALHELNLLFFWMPHYESLFSYHFNLQMNMVPFCGSIKNTSI